MALNWDFFKNWWWAGCVLFIAVLFVINTLADSATVKKHETAFEQIAKIAKNAQDPNKLLYEYLVLHNIDTVVAKNWSLMPRGVLTDANGKPFLRLPFLEVDFLPEKGIMRTYITLDSLSPKTILWEFPRTKK